MWYNLNTLLDVDVNGDDIIQMIFLEKKLFWDK